MLKPNIVGLPVFADYQPHASTDTWNMANLAANAGAWNDPVLTMFIVNAAIVSKWGGSIIHTTQTVNLARGKRFAMGQQIQIPKPYHGNAIGFEITGSISMQGTDTCTLQCVGAVTSVNTNPNQPQTLSEVPTYFGDRIAQGNIDNDKGRRFSLNYRQQILYADTFGGGGAPLAYTHGFEYCDAGSTANTALPVGKISARFHVRTLDYNDVINTYNPEN